MCYSRVRWMVRHDLPQVVEIEADSFDRPWDTQKFLSVLKTKDIIGLVYDPEGTGFIAGYVIYQLKPRAVELLNLAVRPSMRRCGFGSGMVNFLKDKLHGERRKRLGAFVRESNLPAQLLMRSLGIRCKFISYGHYNTGENAYRFEFDCTKDAGPVGTALKSSCP